MAAKKIDPIINVEDDGLIIPEVGAWGEKKYKLVGGYCDIFTTGMRYKWGKLVYIDLFSGSGYARIKDTNKIVKSSALISLSSFRYSALWFSASINSALVSQPAADFKLSNS